MTVDEKRERAEVIARTLSDNKVWLSHARPIGIETLTSVLRLEIDDYSKDDTLRQSIRDYHDLLVEWAHTRKRDFLLDGNSRN